MMFRNMFQHTSDTVYADMFTSWLAAVNATTRVPGEARILAVRPISVLEEYPLIGCVIIIITHTGVGYYK